MAAFGRARFKTIITSQQEIPGLTSETTLPDVYNNVLFVLFLVFPDLLKVIPASIHVSVILFCTVLIIFALVGAGFFMFNAFGSPYETLHGPVGLYLWSFVACKYHPTPGYQANARPCLLLATTDESA